MTAEDRRDAPGVPQQLGSRARLVARVAVAVVVLAVLLLSHRIGRAEPTGDYRPELPPDALTNGCYPLPSGVVLDLPYQVRSDGDVVVRGEPRRRVLGHYSLVDRDEALARIVASFEDAGFSPEESDEGSLVLEDDAEVLGRRGTGIVAVRVEQLPDTSADTLVRGSFELDLPVVERASDGGWCDNPSSTKRWPDGLVPVEDE